MLHNFNSVFLKNIRYKIQKIKTFFCFFRVGAPPPVETTHPRDGVVTLNIDTPKYVLSMHRMSEGSLRKE
jgi:hypothetical protein